MDVLAQEAGDKGVTIGFPASVGVIWHVTEKVAVRPDFTFASSSVESAFIDSDSSSVSLGISALFYLRKWDSISAYVSPRIAWNRNSTSSEFELSPIPTDTDRETTTNAYSFSASFGAQAWVGRRFSVFGETGIAYTKNTFDRSFDFDTPEGRSVGLRSGVGVVLYF